MSSFRNAGITTESSRSPSSKSGLSMASMPSSGKKLQLLSPGGTQTLMSPAYLSSPTAVPPKAPLRITAIKDFFHDFRAEETYLLPELLSSPRGSSVLSLRVSCLYSRRTRWSISDVQVRQGQVQPRWPHGELRNRDRIKLIAFRQTQSDRGRIVRLNRVSHLARLNQYAAGRPHRGLPRNDVKMLLDHRRVCSHTNCCCGPSVHPRQHRCISNESRQHCICTMKYSQENWP